jgi:chemotaxis protein histidine kinase CheA
MSMTQDYWHIPTSDEELIDVFVEEVGELLESIDDHMSSWGSNPGDRKILTEIRRSFHTIKGSGRMVKALDLSELAWRVEKMLNQAIAGTVHASDAMVELVASVRVQIPRMVDAFKNRRPLAGSRDIENLMNVADALAVGRTSASLPASRAVTAIGDVRDLRVKQLNTRLEIAAQRADEALHRSEMALQQARRAATQSESANQQSRHDCCREVARIQEMVGALSKEVADLRRGPRKTQKESPSQSAAALGTAHRFGQSGVRFEEQEGKDRTPQRFGWESLILSALVGGLIAAVGIVFVQSIT